MERVPEAVAEAAKSGDFSAVRAWLNTVTGDVNRYVINDPCNQKHQLTGQDDYPLLMWAAACGIITPEKVELARDILARGADVDKTDYVDRTALHWASCGVGDASPAMVSLLLSAGADVNAPTRHTRTTPLSYWATDPSSDLSTCLRIRAPLLLVIFERLLRAGARLENSWLERRLASYEDPCYERGDTSLATNASFQEIKSIAEGVLAAGSYRAYLHEQRKQVLVLRSLANRGRAATADPVMNFLVRLGDNGVLWNVLSHWPPPRRSTA